MNEGRRKRYIGNTSVISVTIRQTNDSRKKRKMSVFLYWKLICKCDGFREPSCKKAEVVFFLREERRLMVFENRVLRTVSGPKRDELTGEWIKLHSEELGDLFSLPNIVRVVKSRRMRWAGHVARMGEGEVCTGFWWGNLRERDHWGDPYVDGRIILRWVFRKWGGGLWGLDGVGLG
jgi:hypothetical protein